MPILAGSKEHDYSFASSKSWSHLLPITGVKSPPTKGIHYQKFQRIYCSDQLRAVDAKKEVMINVGGSKYLLPWSTLDEFPSSRLSKLKSCNSYEEITQICDDYDEDTHEFFFDRSPSAFGMIVSFLAAGKLMLLHNTCALSFREELKYWGIAESRLENCCFQKLLQKVEELSEEHKEDELQRAKLVACTQKEETRYGRFMNNLRDMVENPQSGLPGKIFACLSILFVATTAISLCVSTMPDLREEEDRGECSQKCYYIFIIETICVSWFSLEFCLRFIQAKSKCQFFKGPLNIIDFLAISPYYASLIMGDDDVLEHDHRPGGNSYFEKVGLVLRVLRALRILYVMRLARHSLGLQTIGLTMQRCTREFGLLMLFLCVAIALFSPLVYLAENESGKVLEFTSIPASYWWAIISMTTVGYGDMVPRSVPGQMVALSSILSGILIMAFPATSIFHTFSHSYAELRKRHKRLHAQLSRIKSANTISERDIFNESESFASDDSEYPIKYIFKG
ncbi:potassium voltage-gated channel subfamily G member 4 [Ahaetulla prasina]|uniref:potassium voltage-gated channel subfamily G member 4 n=1 Tax=Ahaetulla prasina TaxID=499056 RepID=UPI0026492006|nr:potassium voltage-gated channel subfamily G member 4 [Ahaetulla prasina]